MPGRAREAFERYAEAGGLEGPPLGGLAGYADEVVAQAPALRAQCGEADDEALHALRECEAAARGLLSWIEDTPDRPSRASRVAHGTPAPATAPAPAPRASTRTASVRDRYRRRRTQ